MRPKIAACVLTLLGLAIVASIVWGAMAFVTTKLGVASGYWLVPVFGALGGMVGGVLRSDNKLHLCSFENPSTLKLGILGDTVVGLGGSSALVFLFGGTLLKFDPRQSDSLVLVVSVSFVAGVFGRGIVEAAGQRLLREAREEMKKLVGRPAAVAYTSAAKDLIRQGEHQKALDALQEALQQDPNYGVAYVEQGRALKRLGRVNEALETVEKAIKLDPERPSALYNRACYRSLLGRPASMVAADLRKAISLVPHLRDDARTDSDLNNVRNSPEVRDLLAGGAEPAAEQPQQGGGAQEAGGLRPGAGPEHPIH